jgi:hypothetical protein
MIRLRKSPGLIKEKLAVKGEGTKDFLSEQSFSARIGNLVKDLD